MLESCFFWAICFFFCHIETLRAEGVNLPLELTSWILSCDQFPTLAIMLTSSQVLRKTVGESFPF